ncbi:lipopolysaccharide kinase InaA family protein [Rhodothermus profundi]|uniref:Protein kinase domain-containing protein n=1 Tax=Rhodothermus profundi TaxID=633813 RepID=A0A1M6QE40_9BACT|nr:lipopolysaccharide kinase InaA family protein [Rhodothermus profundi]SHK18512.1 hypothetical protein SAMN04488087_0583 [Rhodothermus profundi]
MPAFPTPSQYREAVQFPEMAFVDPELQQATPEVDALGLPRAISGAFATVFVLQGRTHRWAVRCFHAPVPDLAARYRALARHLARHPTLPLVAFDFQEAGIQVEGQTWPLLKMDWAEGIPLNRFVATHLEHPEVLERLIEAWVALVAQLEAAGMAHGDLQHGNVLVAGEEDRLRLTLVDYDAVYVPALRGRKSPELGHRNYQHPDRSEADFGPWIDRFPALVIYTALQALRHRPELARRYPLDEALLFRAGDLYAPERSPLFQELAAITPLQPVVKLLQQACHLEPVQVPRLADVHQGAVKEVPGRRRARRQRVGRKARTGFERAFLPGLLGIGMLGAGLALMGGGTAGLAVGGGGALVALGMALVHYQRLPIVRRRRRLQRELAFFDELLERLRQQLVQVEQERRAFLERQQTLRQQRLEELREEALYDRLKYHFIDEAAQFEGLSHKVVIRLKAAGIRNAYQATPERVARARQLSDETRARINLWRATLVARYQHELPTRLSPAEELRLERYVRQRLARFDEERQRLLERMQAQQQERAQIAQRLEALPSLTFGRYAGYLLRICALPSLEQAPAPPAPPPVRESLPPVSVSLDETRPWWEQVA